MMEHPGIGDNHNAAVFRWCYKRMGEFIPQLVDEGKRPRVMLEYSGTLLHGLRQMGPDDVFDNLRRITCDPRYRAAVEWLGCPVGPPGGAFHAGAGFPPARAGLAASLRRDLRPGGARPRAGILARRDGAAQPSRTSPTSSSGRSRTAATSGCSCRSTRSSEPDGPGPSANTSAPPGLRSSRGRERTSSPSSRPRAATPNWSAQMQPYYEASGLCRWNSRASKSRRW